MDHNGIERITPEIPFPETLNEETGEWNLPGQYYYGPTPLSEDFFLVSYSFEPANGYLTTDGNLTPDTVGSGKLGLYYRDRFGNLELMYEDEKYSCRYPLILRERETIPAKIPSLLPDETASNADATDDGKETIPGLFGLFAATFPEASLATTLDAGLTPGSSDGWVDAIFSTSTGGAGGFAPALRTGWKFGGETTFAWEFLAAPAPRSTAVAFTSVGR